MADSESGAEAAGRDGPPSGAADGPGKGRVEESPEELRRRVEDEYDFEEFGPADMAGMSAEEWEAAFDPDSWITGTALLDRVEAELRSRVAGRDVFAVVEREAVDGRERVLAYSDEGYAVVHPDGSVEGRGTVLRDVEPSVALASMDSYDVPEPPADVGLPGADEVSDGSGDLGNRMMQVVAGVQVLAGLVLLAAWLSVGLSVVAPMAALGFLFAGAFLFLVVANARLSDRFRAEQYRERLRATGVGSGERPPFVPGPGEPAAAAREEDDGASAQGDGAGTKDDEAGTQGDDEPTTRDDDRAAATGDDRAAATGDDRAGTPDDGA